LASVLRSLTSGGIDGLRLEQLAVLSSVGERLYWDDVTRLRRLVTPTAVITNAYGLTETGLFSERVIASDEPPRSGVVDVGHPLPGRTLWIDAGSGAPASAGIIGEIVVEGELGASGIKMETLPDGRQRYRTGDLGSIGPDGAITHHGRNDREVKVGGNRVDIAAIEAAFRSVPGVLDVAVLATDGGTHDGAVARHAQRTLLIAHVHAKQGLTVAQLRSVLRDRLISAAMPPMIRLQHEPLPQLPSGKLDVGALLAAG